MTRILRLVLMAVFLLAIVGLVAFSILRVQTTQIPVAAGDIAVGQTIEQSDLRMKSVPLDSLYASQYTDVEQIVGKTAVVAISAGSPMLRTTLSETGSLSTRFKDLGPDDADKLIVFVRTDIVRSSGFTIRSGDYVNLMRVYSVNNQPTTSIFLEKVHVVGARNADGNEVTPVQPGAVARSASQRIAGYLLALSPEDAALVAGISPEQLYLIYTTLDAPALDLPVIRNPNDTGN
jgi:Flp pilus assembly protein CpaB